MTESMLLTATLKEGALAGPFLSFFVLAKRKHVTFTKSHSQSFTRCHKNTKGGEKRLKDCYVGERIFLNFIPHIAANPVAHGTRKKRSPFPEKY